MKFGPVAPADALGGVTVHALRRDDFVLKKGTLLGAAEIAAIERAGISDIVVVQLEAGDISEDEAAARLAQALSGDGVRADKAFTGRANLFAERAGVLVVDNDVITRMNRVDEAMTIATLPAFKAVVEGEMLATVKLIPFGVAQTLCAKALAAARKEALRVQPYRVRRVGIVSTVLPGLAPKVIEKTLRVTAQRLAPAQAQIVAELRVAHAADAVATAIDEARRAAAELIIVFGASAIADRRDVIPSAIEKAGGEVRHFGMPVDPGNLLLIGDLDGIPVLGAPGCARSPADNGFDWVLTRLLAGIEVTRDDLTAMGVGGLLMEIVSRPQPRVGISDSTQSIAAIVLAAGRGTRMGGPNKLLAELGGKSLVRIAVEQALASRATSVIVVTGHEAAAVRAALAGLDVTFVHNADYVDGIAVSVKTGIAAVPDNATGAVICLGDMPLMSSHLLDDLIAAFDPERGRLVVVPVHEGRRGNPVLWSRRFFGELLTLDGDTGARHLIARHADAVAEIAVDAQSAFLDIDTPDALAEARQVTADR